MFPNNFQPLPPFQRALKYILSEKFGRGEELPWLPEIWERLVASKAQLPQVSDIRETVMTPGAGDVR